jgi:predicted Zn-dependent protease
MDENLIIYRRSAYGDEQEVKLLIYQDAFQLYDPVTSEFITSLSLKHVELLTEANERITVHFKHSEDVKLIVEDDHPLILEIMATQKKKLLSTGQKVLLYTVFVIAGVLLLNQIFSSVVADIGLKLISPQYEAQLGEEMYQSTVPNSLVDERRTAILQTFANKLQLSDRYNIKVTVLRARDVNAFAVPGGNVVIFTGLLDKMEGYDELVALLGHEVSHITERHTTRALLKDVSNKLFLIFFMDVSQVGAVLLLNADKLRSLSYSRSLEREADEKGLALMMKNKVNVNGMLKMFDRLKDVDTTVTPLFLNTHPLTEKRIDYTRKQIRQINQSNVTVDPVLQELWMNLQRKDSIETGN